MKKIKHILIVNCHFDELRLPIRRKTKIPQPMAPAYLAGVFSPDNCDIRLYDEVYSGPLECEKVLGWPDMLVLTGVNTAFDRMLHLTAYARTKNSRVIVVAGGPAIRALFHHAHHFFDYCCEGDIEQMQDVIEDAFGYSYVSEEFRKTGWAIPRYDLAYWMNTIAYVESSRNCYNKCNFCSLTAEQSNYRSYDMEYLKRQFTALGKWKVVIFLDNNFGSTDKQFIADRFELLKELRERKVFWRWCALVSQDFFLDEENLKRSRDTGCLSLFSGVETFDRKSLLDFRKYQNTLQPQLEIIRRCLEHDITFYYGIVFDIAARSVADLREEIEFMVGNTGITLPSFISLAIPIMGTPFFRKSLKKGLILPNIKLRDLDGTTITMKPHDPLPDVIRFVKDIQSLIGYRLKAIRHSAVFYRRHRRLLSFWHMMLALYNGLLICIPELATARDVGNIPISSRRKHVRTYIGTTEPLDGVYSPAFRVESKYASYFQPTMITDREGHLNTALERDLSPNGFQRNSSPAAQEFLHACNCES